MDSSCSDGWEIINSNLIVKKSKFFILSTTYQDFALVAINPHPGDDIQIQFKIGDDLYVPSDNNFTVDAPRLAVYDKKELWRANLYIDERTSDADRTHDWNDQHPWIGEVDANGTPDPNGANFNQWNHDMSGNIGNGGQVI